MLLCYKQVLSELKENSSDFIYLNNKCPWEGAISSRWAFMWQKTKTKQLLNYI